MGQHGPTWANTNKYSLTIPCFKTQNSKSLKERPSLWFHRRWICAQIKNIFCCVIPCRAWQFCLARWMSKAVGLSRFSGPRLIWLAWDVNAILRLPLAPYTAEARINMSSHSSPKLTVKLPELLWSLHAVLHLNVFFLSDLMSARDV